MLITEQKKPEHQSTSVQLRLNSQQRELLERAVRAEGLTSIAELVRKAIHQSDEAVAHEKSSV
jgi:uncharacterized protein (DUF1778 family)